MDGPLVHLSQQGFHVQAYADDGLVLIRGRLVDVVCERMQRACEVIEEWCRESRLTVNPTKSELNYIHQREEVSQV